MRANCIIVLLVNVLHMYIVYGIDSTGDSGCDIKSAGRTASLSVACVYEIRLFASVCASIIYGGYFVRVLRRPACATDVTRQPAGYTVLRKTVRRVTWRKPHRIREGNRDSRLTRCLSCSRESSRRRGRRSVQPYLHGEAA